MKIVKFIFGYRENERYEDDCLVGWGNGYVAVYKDHPLFEREYVRDVENIIKVHGGLNYSGRMRFFDKKYEFLTKDEELIIDFMENPKDWWIFGFDTTHGWDNIDDEDKNFVISETEKLAVMLADFKKED